MTAHSDYIIHRRSDKTQLYAGSQKFWWSEQLNRWICVSPEMIKTILSRSEFNVIEHHHDKIMERFNVDTSHISKVASCLPVTLDGPSHKALRKQFALMIAANSSKALSFFEKEFTQKIKQEIGTDAEFDLCNALLKPIIQKTSLILSGVEWLPQKNLDKLSRVFDETLSLADRGELNLSIGSIAETLKARLDEEDCYLRIALFALGNDSMLSTMSESIIAMVIKNPNVPLSSFHWDSQIPATGIPVIERIANADLELDGFQIQNGQRVRMYLDSAGYSETNYPNYSSMYFGSGSHLCLGVSVGNQIWSLITDSLKNINKKIKITKLSYRKNDNVFNIYDELKVRFYD